MLSLALTGAASAQDLPPGVAPSSDGAREQAQLRARWRPTLDLTAGVRARALGADIPFHRVAGVGLGLRALAPVDSDRWGCNRYDTSAGPTRATPQGEPRGGGIHPALAAYFGYQSHFGPREEFGFGAEVWTHHDGVLSSSLVFRLLYTPTSGEALPAAARSRGTRAALWTTAVTAGITTFGVLLIVVATGGGHAG